MPVIANNKLFYSLHYGLTLIRKPDGTGQLLRSYMELLNSGRLRPHQLSNIGIPSLMMSV